MCSMCRLLLKKRLQCTTITVNLHVRRAQIVLNKFHVVGPATAKVRRPYTQRAETVEQRVDGGWRNEDAVVQQLKRPVYTAQTYNPVPGLASTRTPSPRACIVYDSICHIEPMQLRVKQVCQAAVVFLRAAHNSRCSVHDPLQLVGNRLWCSDQQQIAIVDLGRNEGVNQYGCRHCHYFCLSASLIFCVWQREWSKML